MAGREKRFVREDPERDIDEELGFHVDRRTAELVEAGHAPDQAERLALAEFGDIEATRRYCAREDRRRLRSSAAHGFVRALADDLRLAWRGIARAPRPVVVPILILAAGIALNALVFSVVRGVLLVPLPLTDPGRILVAAESGGGLGGASYPVLAAWRREASTAAAISAYLRNESVLDVAGEPRHVRTALVTEGWFDMLDRPILVGRPLAPSDHATGSTPSVLVSESFWRTALGSDPDVLGRTLTIDGTPRPVAGVVRSGSVFPDGTRVWLPAETVSPGLVGVAGAKIFTALVLPHAGVPASRVTEELSAISAGVRGGATEASVTGATERFLGDARAPLLLLQGAVLLALLTACANAGGLLLARSTARRGDHAVRTALGAGRVRVGRTVVLEGALIGASAGVLGLLTARFLLQPTLALVPPGLPRITDVTLDGAVVIAALLLSIGTGVATALAPALSGSRVDPAALLRASRGEAGSAPRLRGLLDGFVVGQVALAVLLTVGAGLLLRSFVATMAEDAGFEAAGITVLDVSLPPARYPDAASVQALQRTLLERAAGLPGGQAVAIGVNLPISGSNMMSPLRVDGSADMTGPAQIAAVTSGYFDVLGIPLDGMLDPAEWDSRGGRRLLVVDETMRTAEGRALGVGDRAHSFFDTPSDGSAALREVVAVAGPVRHRGLREAPAPTAYEPVFQRTDVRGFSLLVRSESPEAVVATAARALVSELDPGIATDRVTTMEAMIGRSVAEPRFYAVGLSLFGALSVLLALAGCQAGLAFRVASRRRELGLRVALGASSPRLRSMVLRRGLTLAAAGAGVGVSGALLASRLLEAQLYGVSPHDPVTYVGLVALVLAATAVAADGPARKAAAMDPATVLRED